MNLRIGLVVGESSGDNLAAALITQLQTFYPNLEVEGIVGPKLMQLGAKPLFAMERLAVMGVVEPLVRLPELFKMRSWLVQYFLAEPIDLFIGVDAPDFNLGLEKQLKAAGIPTVHYVSPSVWAWRAGRIHTIKQAVDLMLTLFPFEESFYNKHSVPVKFVGHPAADQISLQIDSAAAKAKLGYAAEDTVVALLPGSRDGEVTRLAKVYLETARLCANIYPKLKFVMPLVKPEHQEYIELLQHSYAQKFPANNIILQTIVGESYAAMAASDVVLVTSGTATLEVMLHKKPMLIAYKTTWLTYEILKRIIKVPYIGLPNLLANAAIAPEYIQQQATPALLSQALLKLLGDEKLRQQQIKVYQQLHTVLSKNASVEAAAAIAEMLGGS